MKERQIFLAVVFGALLAITGCGDDETGTGNTGTGGTGTGGTAGNGGGTGGTGGGSGGEGLCAEDTAIDPCTGQCAYEPPTSINCTTACQNIATVCASGCADGCSGLESDPTLCNAACTGTRNLQCTNLVFGCFSENDTCDGVGNCVANEGG